MERNGDVDDQFPQDVLSITRLRPRIHSQDGELDHIVYYFDLCATIQDVYTKLQTYVSDISRYEVVDHSSLAVSKDASLLGYLAFNDGIIFINKVATKRLDTPPAHPGSTKQLALEPLPSSSLYLDPSDFLHEVSKRMVANGLPSQVRIMNSSLEELPKHVPYVADWLLHTKSNWIILEPCSSSVKSETTATNEDAQSDHRTASIELRPGLALQLSKEYYDFQGGQLIPDRKVADALTEFLNLCRGNSTILQQGADEAGAENEDYAELGRNLRAALVGTGIFPDGEELSDTKLADEIVSMLKENQSKERAVARELAREVLELHSRFRRLESHLVLRSIRYLKRVWLVTRSVVEHFGMLVYRLCRQELTHVVLYSIFWMVSINLFGFGVKAKLIVSLFLVTNVTFYIMRVRYNLDADFLVSHLFPPVYPENTASVDQELVHQAAGNLLNENEVDYNHIVNTLIIQPGFWHVLVAFFLSSFPSLLSRWHRRLDSQRLKLRNAVIAAVEVEKAKLASAQSRVEEEAGTAQGE